jgi:hypothetical protein
MRDDDAAASLLDDDAQLWGVYLPAFTNLKAVPFQIINDDIYLRLPFLLIHVAK